MQNKKIKLSITALAFSLSCSCLSGCTPLAAGALTAAVLSDQSLQINTVDKERTQTAVNETQQRPATAPAQSPQVQEESPGFTERLLGLFNRLPYTPDELFAGAVNHSPALKDQLVINGKVLVREGIKQSVTPN